MRAACDKSKSIVTNTRDQRFLIITESNNKAVPVEDTSILKIFVRITITKSKVSGTGDY